MHLLTGHAIHTPKSPGQLSCRSDWQAAGLQQHPVPACRIELCSAQGVVLRGFGLDECEGGPHEFRGVSRGGLLLVLKDLLPEGTVQYGVRIARASTDINGGALCPCSPGFPCGTVQM